MTKMEQYTLSDGSRIPKIGFGTSRTTGGEGLAAMRTAIDAGYRFFDTASIYETEELLGQAIRESGIPREEFLVETKLWIDEMGFEGAKAALERSLRRLGMDYVDLYMIHWPRETGAADEPWKARDIETWAALEEAVEEGKVRRLGVSNFLPHHLENLLANCRIRPVVDQLELHPGYSQEAAVAYLSEQGILPIAWSPFARGRETGLADALNALGERYGKTPQQISLRFLLQKGILPIPRSLSAAHIRANLDVFDFELTQEDIWMLSCAPQTAWLGEHPDFSIPTKRNRPENLLPKA